MKPGGMGGKKKHFGDCKQGVTGKRGQREDRGGTKAG